MREVNLKAITQLLTFESDCEHIAAVLDEVAFEYADSVITNAHEVIPGRHEGDNLYWLRALRDAVWEVQHPTEES